MILWLMQNWERKSVLNKKDKVEMKYGVLQIITIMCYVYAKGVLDSNFC